MRLLRWSMILLVSSALVACVPARVDPSKPVATAMRPAAQPARRLVVVLPGRRDSLASLQRSGIGEAIQRVWPDADVLYTDLSMPYYLDRSAAQRLHDDVLRPARRTSYREVWLVGASLGGMGEILYDKAYPRDVDGMILLAPYTGERGIHDEIRAAGGVRDWRPGSAGSDDWARALWIHLQTWARDPSRTRNIWLAYGDRDSLRDSIPLVADVLPATHVRVVPGGTHAWRTWTPATEATLHAIDAERAARR